MVIVIVKCKEYVKCNGKFCEGMPKLSRTYGVPISALLFVNLNFSLGYFYPK